MAFFLCFFIFFLASSASASNECVHQSKATYFSKESSFPHGACGYGSLALNLTNGQLAGAVPSLFKNGVGCGACFQVRCNNTSLCTKEGTRVVVTDLNHNSQTDFVLSSQAFKAMAKKDLDKEILKRSIVDIEYKRIPCDYKTHNLSVRVEESSKKPHYLALTFLYQGGQTEIVSVDIAKVGSSTWSFLTRNHGAVWDTSRVPEGPLQLRMVVTGGLEGKEIRAKKEVLPNDWKNGVVYDTGVQINDTSLYSSCNEGEGTW
ncbi:PREDICTED: expansin-like A1 [Lupinus angustifolius]|uniref:expansin-like A1 n=1 Tax=Lupinus angustifolius TaxID=3871 RepID=UPI00092F5F79|nr:PREDICTED: expansin-like A1 [Lupinus angustifolius]